MLLSIFQLGVFFLLIVVFISESYKINLVKFIQEIWTRMQNTNRNSYGIYNDKKRTIIDPNYNKY